MRSILTMIVVTKCVNKKEKREFVWPEFGRLFSGDVMGSAPKKWPNKASHKNDLPYKVTKLVALSGPLR